MIKNNYICSGSENRSVCYAIDMKVTLIISTYNYPQSLKLCLESVLWQTRKPDEIVIADDGSGEETRSLIEEMAPRMPCCFKHVWQEDSGFRKTVIMNKGLAACTGEYIIQIDGDIIMHRLFIEDHLRCLKKGVFICGSRSRITKKITSRLFQGENIKLSFFRPGLDDRLNALRCPLLTPLFTGYKHMRGCNMAFWREDIEAINGYDETIQAYGYEDEDVQERLIRLGRKKRFVKFMCIEYHVFHEEHPTKKDLKETRKLIDKNNDSGLIRVSPGISEHRSENK